MSNTLRPWLADAVAQYRRVHGRNLTFTKKGRLLQVIQFNNYRNTALPEERNNDVYAWAHDKLYEVLVRFEAQAINAFEEKYESFTSYRYGLFQIVEYKFVLGTDYIAEEPRSTIRVRTFADLPNPRMFYLLVTKFNYISSKGEGSFVSRTRKFEELTRNWRIDIEEDEQKKRGLVLQVTASQTHAHDAPPSLEEIQAVADVIRSKRISTSTSPDRLAKRQRPLHVLDPKHMLSIPPELLSTLQSPPVQASDLCTSTKVTTPKTAPEAEKETLLEMLPSTPPPPPSSGSFSVLTVSGGRSSAKKSPRPSNTIHKSVQGDTLLPVKHAACSGLTQSQTPERSKQVAQQEAHTTPSELPVVDSHRTSAAVQKEILRAPVAYSTVKAAPNGAETSGSFARGVSHAVHTSTSTPAKKKRKAEPLPRYPLDSPDDSNERLAAPSNRQEGDSAHQPELTPRQNGLLKKLVPTAPSIDHSQSKATMLVDVGFIRNVKSSPQTVAKGDDTMRVDMPALGIRTFYSGSAVQSYMLDGHPMHSAARTDHLPECLDSRSAKSANVLFDDQDSHGTKSATSVSGESSDGFEFVSFAQGNDDGALKRVKVEDTAMSLLSAFEGERTTLPDLPDFLHMQTARTGSVLAVPNNASKLASRLQLKNVSQQDLDALMSRLHTSTRKNSSTTSFDSESAEVIPTSKGSSMMANLVPLRQSSTLLTNGSLESGQAATRAQIPLITNNPSSTSSAQGGPASSRFRMTASLGARKSTIPRPPSRSISDSGRFGQRSEARKAISEITADIERYLERKGLSRRQSIDLWYCCSGDLDAACQIADNNLSIVNSIQAGDPSTGPGLLSASVKGSPKSTRNAYKRCWTFEDDQVVEDPNPTLFKVARKLQDIESRRGKGSVTSRQRFLTENPLARKLERKVRYPYDHDENETQ